MNVDSRAEAWVSLQLSGVAPRPLFDLLGAFGSPASVLNATASQLRGIVTLAQAKAVQAKPARDRLQATLSWLAAADHSLVAWDDPDYPRALLEISDPPPVFYCLGARRILERTALAIVGSRNATPQGCSNAEAFAVSLSTAGLAIVSGLALGIDAAAHRGALRHAGGTIAVVGTGPDRVYPARNRDLAHQIAEHGAIISEFAPGTPPLREHFPRRNRLISGLSRGVLVVEATLSSGSLITARQAGEQCREVFALPGSIHSPFSKGCHRLIREGAKLVETAQDILDELTLPLIAPAAAQQFATGVPFGALSEQAAVVLGALGNDTLDVDAVVDRAGLSPAIVTATLTALELDGRVAAIPGGGWQRIG
jgi:DNA processing protein